MAACRNTSFLNSRNCPCHLCTKQRFDGCQHLPATQVLGINSIRICVHDLTRLTPPNIFCPYIAMWQSQYIFCCCVNHSDIADCEINWDLKPKCKCFKCCKLCSGQNSDSDNDCLCHLKDRLYIPCDHYRGKCSSLQ